MIKYAICIDDQDPFDLDRIRAIIVDGIQLSRDFNDILRLVSKNDTNSNYVPWSYPNINQLRDPYLMEPFIPTTTLTDIPTKGQLVKVIAVNDNVYEYVGAVTKDYLSKKQPYILSNKGPVSKNYKRKGLKPNTNDIVLGTDNSQIIINNNRISTRIGFNDNGVKQLHPFEDLFINDDPYNLTSETNTVTQRIDNPIDYICVYEIKFTFNELYSTRLEYNIYKADNIINQNGLTGLKESELIYENELFSILPQEPIFTLTASSNNMQFLSTILKECKSSVIKGKLPYIEANNSDLVKNIVKSDGVINLVNNTINEPYNNGYDINDYSLIKNPNILAFIININQVKLTSINQTLLDVNGYSNGSNNYALANGIINGKKITVYNRLPSKTETTSVTTVNKNRIGVKESSKVFNVDKFLLNTTSTSTNLSTLSSDTNTFDYDTFINKFNESSSFIRGEELLNVLILLIETILNHGHIAGVDPRVSIIDTSKLELTAILDKLKSEVKGNITTTILNKNAKIT